MLASLVVKPVIIRAGNRNDVLSSVMKIDYRFLMLLLVALLEGRVAVRAQDRAVAENVARIFLFPELS